MKKTSRSPRRAASAPKGSKAARPLRRSDVDTMRPEYDFSGGVRNKYAALFAKGTNLVRLDPDVAAAFRDGESVNRALRALIEIAPKPRARRVGKRTT